MENLRRMAVFAAVVETSSFTAAARRLGLTRSAVSKHVRALEDFHGVQLLLRTTRQVVPTAVGTRFYTHCADMLRASEAALAALTAATDEPRGTLRVTAPVGLGERLVAPALAGFLADNPDVAGELVLTEAMVDLVGEGYDVAVRAGRLRDSSSIARKVAPLRLIVCASPDYLGSARGGAIRGPGDLERHDWILFGPLGSPQRLVFRRRGRGGRNRQKTIRAAGRVTTNNGDAIVVFMMQGLGLGVLPELMVSGELARGELVRVLADHELPMGEIYAVYPAMRHVPARVRGFVDALVAALGSGGARDAP